jgi:S-(hydroxymethyl)glutathione dehydrogenase/alcohol dehydrogenase
MCATMAGMRGIVWTGDALELTDALEVREPGYGEVWVRVAASGICHSDLNVLDGNSSLRPPVVLGHEAAGVVERHGPGVSSPPIGARVVVNAMTPCRRCAACDTGRLAECRSAFSGSGHPFTFEGAPVRSYAAVSSFAELVTVRADQLVEVPEEVPFTTAAVVGCAVTTGFGSVRNVAGVDAGATVVVFGIGGIGVNVLQTCRVQRASRIVAVDIDAAKTDVAWHFGATDTITLQAGDDPVAALRSVVPGGFDFAFECSGSVLAAETSVAVLAPGGCAVLIGIPPRGARASFDIASMFAGRRITGSYNGAVRAHHDIPLIFELARQGALDLDAVVTRTYPVESVHDALRDLREEPTVRTVLTY